MMAQRLLISSEVAWSRFASGQSLVDPQAEEGELLAFVEQASRLGIDREDARAFFAAQQAAARTQEEWLVRQWKNPKNRPQTPVRSVELVLAPQLTTVDSQITVATVRLRGFPKGKAVRRFVFEKLIQRGISPRAAKEAVRPLGPSRVGN
jgi:chorismate mutase